MWGIQNYEREHFTFFFADNRPQASAIICYHQSNAIALVDEIQQIFACFLVCLVVPWAKYIFVVIIIQNNSPTRELRGTMLDT